MKKIYIFVVSIARAVFDVEKFENDLANLVENLLECNEIPGLTLAVGDFKNGYFYTNGFGVTDVKRTGATKYFFIQIFSFFENFDLFFANKNIIIFGNFWFLRKF